MTDDYIKREDAIRAMAQYMMDTALIDNPEASDRIEQWEGSIAAPVMSTVPSADVVEVVRCKDCLHRRESMSRGTEMSRRLALNYCPKALAYVPGNHYCGYGEREEE